MTAALALRAEWTKFTTLRSQWVTPLLAVLLTAGITAAVQAAYGEVDASLYEDPGVGIYYGLLFGQTAVVCTGVLLIGQEFASGTIRVSLAAVPRRGRLYGAKLLLGAGVGLVVGLLSVGGAHAATAATVGLDLSEPGAARSIAAGVLYHPLLLVICLGAATMLRNLTAAMGLLTPTVFLGTTVLSGVPGAREVARFLPDRAGLYATSYHADPDVPYGHWTGLLIMALWAAAAAYGGLRSIRRHDA
ncbi:ABC transporter [Kitasatospora sp. NE20-6]|uniref:ABC transporter permease n=1 Tax=Kitasatospora sp. NE20-6 TaxID=2859066 RepID=UPI0034DBFC0C